MSSPQGGPERPGLNRRAVLLLGGGIAASAAAVRWPRQQAHRIGLFVDAHRADVPGDVHLVATAGFQRSGAGMALYRYDAHVDAAYVSARPNSAFRLSDGRGYRLVAEDHVDLETMGLRPGLEEGAGARNRKLLSEALAVSRKVLFPAGEIDFRGEAPFVLPALDGIEIAGRDWRTKLVSVGTAFLIPTLAGLTIRDLWIEQTATGGATITSLHTNLRDVRLSRLKLTMQDQATCQANCIGLVMDNSPMGADGFRGLKGLLIEDCWLAPGRMGIEIQNHGAGAGEPRPYGYADIVIRGCTIWKAPAFAGMGVSLTGWGRNCLIERNRFVACHGPNVELVGSDAACVADNVFIDAIGTPVSASNVHVMQNCRIVRNRTQGTLPLVGFFLEALDGAEVAHNNLATSGTFVVKGSNISIHDNRFTAVGHRQLMQLDHAHHAVIERNVFRSIGPASRPLPMIVAFGKTSNCVIRDNDLIAGEGDIDRDDLWYAQGSEVRGSIVRGNRRHGAYQRSRTV